MILRQATQDEVGALRDVGFWQDAYLISKRRVGIGKPLVLCNGRFQAVTSLLVDSIYLLPRRRKEHPSIESMGSTECNQCPLTGQMLKGSGSIDQASVEKYPPAERLS